MKSNTKYDFNSNQLNHSIGKEVANSNMTRLDRKYNFDEVGRILNYDSKQMSECIIDLKQKIILTKSITEKVLKSGNYKELQAVFHDLLNILGYYNAHELIKLIMKFMDLSNNNLKREILDQIHIELNEIDLFLIKYNYT